MSIVVLIGVVVLCIWLADKKGYNKLVWFLGSGLLGAAVLAAMPNTNDPSCSPEKAERWHRIDNIIGLSIFAIGFALVLALTVSS